MASYRDGVEEKPPSRTMTIVSASQLTSSTPPSRPLIESEIRPRPVVLIGAV